VHSDKGHDSFLLEPQLYTPHLSFTLDGRWNKGSVDRPVQEVEQLPCPCNSHSSAPAPPSAFR
jgi:hypothetical protein